MKNEITVLVETVEGTIVYKDEVLPTIYDVASLAGVSIATVSRVVNGTAVVRAKTAWRVNCAIEQLNWDPNENAVRTALCK